MRVTQGENAIYLQQDQHIRNLLQDVDLADVNEYDTPMACGFNLDSKDSKPLNTRLSGRYKSLIGGLLYIAGYSRPDISFSVSLLARCVQNPHWIHWKAARRVLGYLKKTIDFSLVFPRSESELKVYAWCDADWAGDPITRRSTDGIAVFVGESLVAWKSKLQPTTALSTCEAEIRSLSNGTMEALAQQYLLENIYGELANNEIQLLNDNKSAVDVSRQTSHFSKLKHVELRHLFVREVVQSGKAEIRCISSTEMIADIFTKPLDFSKFDKLRKRLNLGTQLAKQSSSGSVGAQAMFSCARTAETDCTCDLGIWHRY